MSGEEAPRLTATLATLPVSDLPSYFQLERCREWCKGNGFSWVALQFPDNLLAYGPRVSDALNSDTVSTHILADTAYGACCVDEVAAQRLNTHAIIHFGHSCNSLVLSLPTLFVWGEQRVEMMGLVTAYKQTFTQTDHVLVVFDPVYYHCVAQFRDALRGFPNASVKRYAEEQNTENCQNIPEFRPSEEEYHIFYVGSESLALTNCILSNGSRKVWSFDPETNDCRLESKFVNKMLIKRFMNIEKIRNTQIIGILVATLGMKDFREVINRMKQVIKAADKKYYVVSIGKPNPPKLANFAEIGAFVIIGCAENSLLDCAEFYQPIVTPYELEIACVDRSWEIDYISDCSSLLHDNYMPIPEPEPTSDAADQAIEKFRSLDIAVNFLNERSWNGLEQRLGENEPAVLKQGQKGIAGFYEGEPEGDSRLTT